MSTDFFVYGDSLTPHTTARSADVKSEFEAVETGLAALPAEILQNEGRVSFGTDTGAADAYVVAVAQTVTLTKGMVVTFFPVNANTGPSTINLNTLGAVSAKRPDGTALALGDLLTTRPAEFMYDGTNFLMTTGVAQPLSAQLTDLSAFTIAEIAQLANIGATTISATQWGYLGALDQALATTDTVAFSAATITTLSATDVNSTNLDGIIGGDTARAASFTTVGSSSAMTSATTFILSGAAGIGALQSDTSDGADNKFVSIRGGGGAGINRGAQIQAYGNEATGNEGSVLLLTGNIAGAFFRVSTGSSGNTRVECDDSGDWDFQAGGIVSTGTAGFGATTVASLISGGDIVSDTDSTDSLGSTGVRWANTWTDTINGVTSPTAQYTTAEETKLSNIEASADVTDSTNVLASLVGTEVVAAGFTGTLDGILGGGTPAAVNGTTGVFSSTLAAGITTITSASVGTVLTVSSTDAGVAEGPVLDLYRNSGTPTGGDVLGALVFNGEEATSSDKVPYSKITSTVESSTENLNDGALRLYAVTDGSYNEFCALVGGFNKEIHFNREKIASLDFIVDGGTTSNLFKIDGGTELVSVAKDFQLTGGQLIITNDPDVAAAANTIRLGSNDLSAGNTIPSFRCEGLGIVSAGTPAASTGSIAMSINGVIYYFTVSTTAAS